jgi:succinate-semialdehyde dehydrogenase/glutarate-semialdehyde dehydrogenase
MVSRSGSLDGIGSSTDLVTTTGERESFSVAAPFTGASLGTVPYCTPDDVATAVERARTAQTGWADRTFDQRASIVLAYHDAVLDQRAELVDLVVAESGKARGDAVEELLDVAITARHYATRGDDYLAPERRSGALPLLTRTVERARPVGVVGIVAPWNYPLTLAVSDAIPALLAGNAVVLKPAEQTPLTALRAVELLYEAGLPEDLFQVVTGDGPTLGEPLVANVDHVCFTGSTEAGRDVAALAGRHLTKHSLELGGKNPMLVLGDADPNRAAAGAVTGAFASAGQLCLAIERIYVESSLYEPFLDAFVDRTRSLEVDAEDGFDVDVGSLISADQLAKVQSHVRDAIEQGATVRAGGRHRPDLGPYVYEPTILTGVTPAMRLFDEETFGPVVAVYEVADADEAVARANDSQYGLNASVYAGDDDRGERVAREIAAGTVNVNAAYAAAWASVDAPMGGVGDSGIGRRHGRQGIRRYTEAQTVAVHRGPSLTPPSGRAGRLWTRAMVATLRAWRRLAAALR